MHRSSRYLPRLALAALIVLLVGVLPASASHIEDPRSGLEEVGFHGFGNQGFNTDVWTWTAADGRLMAVNGTWGTLTTGGFLGEECPSETDNPLDPTKSGVKIVDASDPSSPVLVSRIGTIPGSQNNDVKVARIDTHAFQGDVLVHSLEPCGAEGILAQIPGAPFSSQVPVNQTGFVIYDVTEPSGPVELGRYNNGDVGVHNLYIFTQPDPDQPGKQRAYVANTFFAVDQLELGGSFLISELQIVDITDPAAVLPLGLTEPIGRWTLDDAVGQGGPPTEELCRERGTHFAGCLLHDVWISDDGSIAYLSYWDAGLILLDVSDPANPQFLGQIQSGDPADPVNEGNTHVAVPYEVDGAQLVIVGDEDFVAAGGSGPQASVTIDAAPDGAPVTPGEHIAGTEFSDTEPLANGPFGPFPVFFADDEFGCDWTSASTSGVTEWIGLAQRGGPDPCNLFQAKFTAATAAGGDGLIVINNVPGHEVGTAAAVIPGIMVDQSEGGRLRDSLVAGDPSAVQVTLQIVDVQAPTDPWGFMRVIDAADPANMVELSTFEAPHVRDVPPDPQSVFSAHNPLVGPDGRIYFAWYANGVRVLEVSATGAVSETAWFAPQPGDHPDDNDSDPHGAQEDNIGFWGSMAVCHPDSGDLLVFNTDLNRGLYILRAEYEHDCRPEPGKPSLASGGGRVPGRTSDGPATFGFNAREADGAAEGHISVLDHGTGDRVLSSSISRVSIRDVEGGREVQVEGSCRLNGGDPQPCTATAVDRSASGGDDEFRIEVRTVDGETAYAAGGALERGDIRVR